MTTAMIEAISAAIAQEAAELRRQAALARTYDTGENTAGNFEAVAYANDLDAEADRLEREAAR